MSAPTRTRREQHVSHVDPAAALSLAAVQALAGDPARREHMALVRRHIADLTADQASTGTDHNAELDAEFEALAHIAGL